MISAPQASPDGRPSRIGEVDDEDEPTNAHSNSAPTPNLSWTAADRTIYLGVFMVFLLITLLGSGLFSMFSASCPKCPECNCGSTIGAGSTSSLPAGLGYNSGSMEQIMGKGLALLCLTIVTCILASYFMMVYEFSVLPDCIAYVLIGVVVGCVVRLSGSATETGYTLPNQEQLFLFILPPIIFEAGYSLNKKDFFRQAGSILMFAIVGTLVSAIAFGVGMYMLGILHVTYGFSFWEALRFGSLISSVDPVATIAIFNALKVDKTVHFLVFGESVLNDAVSIVLYRFFSDLSFSESKVMWYQPITMFLSIFVGSTIVGIATALMTALMLKHIQLSSSPTLEFSFYTLMAFLPFFICEGMGSSGIMGVLASGVCLGHYAYYNLSKTTQSSSHQAFRMISFVCETFMFVFLGVSLTTFRHEWDIPTVMFAILLTLVSRACNVFPISMLINRYRASKINPRFQFIMWFSGLRGAISFALALSFVAVQDETRKIVISTTLAVVIFTVIALGGGTFPILRLLRVQGSDDRQIVRQLSRMPKLSHEMSGNTDAGHTAGTADPADGAYSYQHLDQSDHIGSSSVNLAQKNRTKQFVLDDGLQIDYIVGEENHEAGIEHDGDETDDSDEASSSRHASHQNNNGGGGPSRSIPNHYEHRPPGMSIFRYVDEQYLKPTFINQSVDQDETN
eukprot:CAMPEP_0184692074 /NCGR_PEP_ID=MMETSP0313-20130426/701_1 /TAXON_ID=2792 /ORGANISM="Porphyridium aerugineum, Strain SAG 1380-2" /LENGTH=679 /DNA_ID=CAMNT_0027149877 /DNA_START=9 /DNA_END=2048 /DNA_ORIENTATION=+